MVLNYISIAMNFSSRERKILYMCNAKIDKLMIASFFHALRFPQRTLREPVRLSNIEYSEKPL